MANSIIMDQKAQISKYKHLAELKTDEIEQHKGVRTTMGDMFTCRLLFQGEALSNSY
jgi:hypothetical protein